MLESNSLKQLKENFLAHFTSGDDKAEAQAVFHRLLLDKYHISKSSYLFNKEALTEKDYSEIEKDLKRLKANYPLQYLLGYCEFRGEQFLVNESVLIPRPETEELVELALKYALNPQKALDIGTGSGVIAISLSSKIKAVEAWDISDQALRLAQKNNDRLGRSVQFVKQNALAVDLSLLGSYDLIISNPPYVMASEAAQMEERVLNHEPHLALFVEDENPLIFYRSIAKLAQEKLRPKGLLAFEINPLRAQELEFMLNDFFERVWFEKDLSGKIRFAFARK